MIKLAQQQAQSKAQPLIEEAQQRVDTVIGEEFNRLTELKALNGTIRDDEIALLKRAKPKR